jgi:hypothetical protein
MPVHETHPLVSPVLAFVPYRSRHYYECQNRRDTSDIEFWCGFGFDIRMEDSRQS